MSLSILRMKLEGKIKLNNDYERALKFIEIVSGRSKASLNKPGLLSAISKEVYFGDSKKAYSALNELHKNGFLIMDDKKVLITDKTLCYLSETF